MADAPPDVPSDVQMKDVDVFMSESMDRYLNNDNFGGWFAEYNAVSIVYFLEKKNVPQAKAAKPILLSQASLEQFKKKTSDLSTSLYQQRASARELDLFEKNNYDNFISWYGQAKADERRTQLSTKKENDLTRYNAAKKAYEDELNEMKKNAPTRASAYIALRGASFAESNEDPIVLMNKVLADVNTAYPEYSYTASDMNEQLKLLHGNYKTDAAYLNSVHSLLSDLSDNLMPSLEKKMHYKERQQEIHEYYHKQYDQQIFLVKLLIFISLFAIAGSVLLHYKIISITVLAVYLGILFSVAFVVFFYYLWDFYIRDNNVFDEYEFNVYFPPSNGNVLKSTFKDNIIYC